MHRTSSQRLASRPIPWAHVIFCPENLHVQEAYLFSDLPICVPRLDITESDRYR